MKVAVALTYLLATTPVVSWAQTNTNGPWTYFLDGSGEANIISYDGPGGDVVVPSELDGYRVRQFGTGGPVFGRGNTSVTSVALPDSVTDLGWYAFQECSGLTNISLGNGLTSIGWAAFVGVSTNLVSLTVPITANFMGWHTPDLLRVDVDAAPLATSTKFVSALIANESFIDAVATNARFINLLAQKIISSDPDNYGIATKGDIQAVISNSLTYENMGLIISNTLGHPDAGLVISNFVTNHIGVIVSNTIAQVQAAPGIYNLYTSDSIMDLKMGGMMIQKEGASATISIQPQTTTDLVTQPFTNNGSAISHTIPMPGNKMFMRFQATTTPPPPNQPAP